MNIEEVAEETPDAIIKEPVDITVGLTRAQALSVADQLGLTAKRDQAADMFQKLYELFIKHDATMIEINPLAEDSTGNCEPRPPPFNRMSSFIDFFFIKKTVLVKTTKGCRMK